MHYMFGLMSFWKDCEVYEKCKGDLCGFTKVIVSTSKLPKNSNSQFQELEIAFKYF